MCLRLLSCNAPFHLPANFPVTISQAVDISPHNSRLTYLGVIPGPYIHLQCEEWGGAVQYNLRGSKIASANPALRKRDGFFILKSLA